MAISNQQVATAISEAFPGAVLKNEELYGMLTLEISKEKIKDVISWIKQDEQFKIHFLTLLGGMHYPDNKGHELGVVYHFHSLQNNFRIRLKTFLSIVHPHIPTITDLFDSANWQERETYDFFGVWFDGHPNMKRILNEDDMDYHPMRKEYHLEDATRDDKDDRYFGR